MGLRVKNAGRVAKKLVRTGKRTSKAALRAVRHGAKDIAELAKQMAPVDEGNLEDAIEVDEPGLEGRRKVIVVKVDTSRPVPSRPNKTVGDYAIRMHEGVYNLGPRSQEKQASQPGVAVGRKYLERAADELKDEIVKNVRDALRGKPL